MPTPVSRSFWMSVFLSFFGRSEFEVDHVDASSGGLDEHVQLVLGGAVELAAAGDATTSGDDGRGAMFGDEVLDFWQRAVAGFSR